MPEEDGMPKAACSRNWHRVLLVAVTLVVATEGARGQDTNSNRLPANVLGRSVCVSADDPTAPHVESFLALDPKDPSQLVASSIVAEHGEGAAVYLSRDTGGSWARATSFGADVPPFSGADPIVYDGLSGAALFGSIRWHFDGQVPKPLTKLDAFHASFRVLSGGQ